jgi:hypothetical protein
LVALSAFKTVFFCQFVALGSLYRQILATKNKLKKRESKCCYRWALAKETDTKMAKTGVREIFWSHYQLLKQVFLANFGSGGVI